ncbi:MAG: Cation efflux system protein CusB precursor [Syntrophorhabdus sp. PtaU1.Bin050]|nr:MAG: Cation efflux system protein CusB precursor [Syntrophorhabdus sp. PtaU1.Bin050]
MEKRIATICFVIVTVGIVCFFASCKGGHNAEKATSIENKVTETSQSAKPEEPSQKQEETPTVEIPPEKQQLIGVRTVAVSIQPVEKIVRTTGKIEYDERKLTTINTKVEGWIEKLYVNFTGVYVKKGAPLADIYSPELWATQQEFINLVRWAKKTAGRGARSEQAAPSSQEAGSLDLTAMLSKDTESLLEAARQRLKLWDISDAQIKKIEENEKPIRTLTIYSPAGGYVLQKYAIQGMKVMAGEKLFDVSDLSSVWVLADIYEYELPVIQVGNTAKLRLSYFPGKELTSKIEFISPTLSNETRTAQVRFSVPNTGGKLKPGMLTDVEMKINLGKRLVVPDEAVIDTGLRQIVYVDKGDGYFEPRAITPGLRAGNLVEVLQGLETGEKVASSANFLIDSEAKLKGVEARGSAPGVKQEGPPAPVGHKH